MAPMNTSQFDKSTIDISKNIKIMTGALFSTFPKEWPSIIDKETTDLKIDKSMGYEGPGAAPEKAEGANAASTRLYEGYTEAGIQASFVYEMPVTWEQRKFVTASAKFSKMLGEFMARSQLLRYEYTGANVQNNGFTAAAYAGADSKAYYAADHPWKSGGTYDNVLTAADLSYTSLKASLVEVAQQKGERSIPASLQVKSICISTENILVLPELLKSTMDPDTANNTYNAVKDFNLKKILDHYYSDTDAWFVDTQVKTRILLEAEGPAFDQYIEDKTKNLVERGWSSIATRFEKQFGAFGNEGA